MKYIGAVYPPKPPEPPGPDEPTLLCLVCWNHKRPVVCKARLLDTNSQGEYVTVDLNLCEVCVRKAKEGTLGFEHERKEEIN